MNLKLGQVTEDTERKQKQDNYGRTTDRQQSACKTKRLEWKKVETKRHNAKELNAAQHLNAAVRGLKQRPHH